MMTYSAETLSHPTQVVIWYPALNPTGETDDIVYDWYGLPLAGHAIQDAAPDVQEAPYPLVIFAHGLASSRLATPYLSEQLASRGFIVMSIDFADNQGTVDPIALYSLLFTRPQDISWEIDQAVSLTATGGKLEGVIDTERIAVVGHSLGGYTALAAGGAQIDLTWAQRHINEPRVCIKPPELGGINACADTLDHQQALADLAGLDAVPDKLWPSWGDTRVDAIVGLAPAGELFGPDGVVGVTVPTMLMVGSMDRQVSPELSVDTAYEHLGSTDKALITFENADHMIYFWKCSDGPWAVDFGAHWACSDPVWDMDRAHDLINHFTTAFLLDTLKGNNAAHAALAPDAVSFPGITYQAQGF